MLLRHCMMMRLIQLGQINLSYVVMEIWKIPEESLEPESNEPRTRLRSCSLDLPVRHGTTRSNRHNDRTIDFI